MAPHALIVEDDPETGYLEAEIVRSCGFEPTVLPLGWPALAWVREHRPELLILDLMLPDMDGYDIYRQLKLDLDTNLTPIVIVTAQVHEDERVRGLDVGAHCYLTKPFTGQQFRDAIAQVLAWRADLQRRGTEGEIRFRLRSDTRYLKELNDMAASLFLFSRLSPVQVRQLTTAVRELGVNAIEWGHQWQAERLVTVTYRIDPDKITIVIRDTGPGFDLRDLPHAANPQDPTAHLAVRQERGVREGGFGIMIARGLVDELRYNETGNEVTVVKYYPAPGKDKRMVAGQPPSP